jgi:hypothetical protein
LLHHPIQPHTQKIDSNPHTNIDANCAGQHVGILPSISGVNRQVYTPTSEFIKLYNPIICTSNDINDKKLISLKRLFKLLKIKTKQS